MNQSRCSNHGIEQTRSNGISQLILLVWFSIGTGGGFGIGISGEFAIGINGGIYPLFLAGLKPRPSGRQERRTPP